MSSKISRTLSVLSMIALLASMTIIGSLAARAAAGGPTVVLSSTSASTTSAALIPVTATFSEAVTGFGSSTITATNATVSNVTGTGASYSFSLVPSATGTTTVQIAADVVNATASSTLGNQVSNMLTFMSTAGTTSAPVLSGITVVPTGTTTATISWNTDVPATGQVLYGSTSSYDASSTLNTSLTTSHTSFLGGLFPATLYHFAVRSANASGTTTSSDQTFTQGATSTATTTPVTATSTLAVVGVDSVSNVAIADGTFANGWKWVIHFTVPTNETSFRLKFADFTSSTSSGSIPVAGNMRYYSAQSSNATSSASAIVNANNGYGSVGLTLTGDTSTTTAGRQVDVTIESSIPSGTPAGSYSTIFGALSI